MPQLRRLLPGSLVFALLLGGLPTAAVGQQTPPGRSSLLVSIERPAALASAEARVTVGALDSAGPAPRPLERTIRLGIPTTFGNLSPGRYAFRIEVPGALPIDGQVRVGPDELVVVGATVVPAGSDPPPPTVTRQPRDHQQTRFDRLLRDLPAATSLWGMVETSAPYVISDTFDNGGLGTVRPARFGVRGESWRMTTVTFGDLEVRQPAGGGLLAMAPDLASVEVLGVAERLAPVEVRTAGVHLSLVPRMPTPTWSGSVRGSITAPGMVATNARPGAPSVARLESWRQGGLTLGGPLGEGRGLLISFGAVETRYQEPDRVARARTSALTAFGQAVVRAGAGHQFRAIGGVQRLEHPLEDRRQFADATADLRTSLGQVSVSWDRVGPGGGRRTVRVGFQRSLFEPRGAEDAGGTVDRLLDGVVPAPAARQEASTFDVGLDLDRPAFVWAGATHLLRTGAVVRHAVLQSAVTAGPVVAETVAGLPARVWQPVLPAVDSRRSLTEVSAWVGDQLAIGRYVSVQAGLRFDGASGSARGADTGIRWATLSPRLSFRWRRSVVAVFGGYGRYLAGDALPLLEFGDPGVPWAEVSRWTDPDGSGTYEAGEAGSLVALAGRGQAVAAIDDSLRAPTSHEWVIGGEYHPHPALQVHGAIVVRRQRDLVASTNVGLSPDDYRSFEIDDANADEYGAADDRPLTVFERLPSSFGRDAFLLTNPPEARASYGGIELGLRLETDRWAMLFAAQAYRTRGWGGDLGPRVTENDQLVVGARFEDPNALVDPQGSFFFDRSYVGKWSGSYRAPGDVRVGFVARYQDGQPFSRVVVLPDLAGGPVLVHAYRVGRTRYTYSATVDLRVEKGLRVGSRRASVHLDVFNLTNHSNEVEEDILTGPSFRESTLVQPPLTVRAGFRLDF